MKQDRTTKPLLFVFSIFLFERIYIFLLFSTESFQRSISCPSQNPVQVQRMKTVNSRKIIHLIQLYTRGNKSVIFFAVLTLKHFCAIFQVFFAWSTCVEYIQLILKTLRFLIMVVIVMLLCWPFICKLP